MESNLTTVAFVIGAFAFIIAVIGRIKTVVELPLARRLVLVLFGSLLMGLSFISYIRYQPFPESPTAIATQESSSSASSTFQTSQRATQQSVEVVPPDLVERNLVYENNFNDPSGWSIEEGVAIEDGNLIIRPGYDAVPEDTPSYTDFIFESRFYIPGSGSMAFYLRHQRPPCPSWNCSIQVALYYDNSYQELAARRLSDTQGQPLDLKKARISSLNSPGWNEIIVQATGNLYTVYINDTFIFDFIDDIYTSGAFMLDNALDSSGEVKIDYIRIFQVP